MDDKSVVTASDITITCAMSGLSQTASVSWTDPDGATISDGEDYTVVQGTESGGTQESTLTIKTDKLKTLRTTSTFTPFTCDVISGEYPYSETSSNTMTLTTLVFGKFNLRI